MLFYPKDCARVPSGLFSRNRGAVKLKRFLKREIRRKARRKLNAETCQKSSAGMGGFHPGNRTLVGPYYEKLTDKSE